MVAQKRATNNPKNPFTEIIDHAIKLDMAKQIAMIQRNDKVIEYINTLNSKGRDCEIYYDIKQEILKRLEGEK